MLREQVFSSDSVYSSIPFLLRKFYRFNFLFGMFLVIAFMNLRPHITATNSRRNCCSVPTSKSGAFKFMGVYDSGKTMINM